MIEPHASNPPLRTPGGPIALVRKLWAVLTITIAARFAYVGELLVRTIFLALILYIFTQLWRATNASVGAGVQSLTGFSVAQLVWYLAFTEAIILSASGVAQEVDREVKSGDIAYRLARPLPYPVYHLGVILGERALRFALNLVVASVIALVVVGPIALTPVGVAAGVAAALGSFVADFVISFALSLLSFWIEDTNGLHLLYSRALMILGGLLIPLDAYPTWLGTIARALPFQYLIYQPARLFVQGGGAWLQVLGTQALIAAVALVPMLIIYALGLRRVSAQGG